MLQYNYAKILIHYKFKSAEKKREKICIPIYLQIYLHNYFKKWHKEIPCLSLNMKCYNAIIGIFKITIFFNFKSVSEKGQIFIFYFFALTPFKLTYTSSYMNG